MPRLPSRLYGPALLTNVDAQLISPAAGHTFVIRHIHINNTSGSAATFILSVGADAAGTELFTSKSVAANDVYDWFGLLIVNATESFRGHAGTTNVLNITINGDDYTLG